MVIYEVQKSKYMIIKKARGKKFSESKYATKYTSTINNPKNKILVKAKKGTSLRYF